MSPVLFPRPAVLVPTLPSRSPQTRQVIGFKLSSVMLIFHSRVKQEWVNSGDRRVERGELPHSLCLFNPLPATVPAGGCWTRLQSQEHIFILLVSLAPIYRSIWPLIFFLLPLFPVQLLSMA